MAKKTMTPDGVDAKRTELYALPKVDLLAEAAAVEADFEQWMNDNFILSTSQETYLAGIDGDAKKYFGMQLATCFRNELTFTLVWPTPPPAYGGKWVDEKNTVKYTVNQSGDTEVEGEVTFTMVYRT